MIFASLGCCGIKEIQGLSSWPQYPDSFFHAVRDLKGNLQCAWVCFNGVKASKYVEEFAQFVAKEGLGDIHKLPDLTNPNSSNILDVQMWAVDKKAVKAWYDTKVAANHICTCYSCLAVARQKEDTARRIAENTERFRQATLAQQAQMPPPSAGSSTTSVSTLTPF